MHTEHIAALPFSHACESLWCSAHRQNMVCGRMTIRKGCQQKYTARPHQCHPISLQTCKPGARNTADYATRAMTVHPNKLNWKQSQKLDKQVRRLHPDQLVTGPLQDREPAQYAPLLCLFQCCNVHKKVH